MRLCFARNQKKKTRIGGPVETAYNRNVHISVPQLNLFFSDFYFSLWDRNINTFRGVINV